jgi:hypothetical protein
VKMNDQKIKKEALELINRCDKLEATSQHIRNNAMEVLRALKADNVNYEALPLPGTADIVALANRVNTVGTVLDCYICLAAEVDRQS